MNRKVNEYRCMQSVILLIVTIILLSFQQTVGAQVAENTTLAKDSVARKAYEDLNILREPVYLGEEILPGEWSVKQRGLFDLYNSQLGKLENFVPYTCEAYNMHATSYPRIFYLDLDENSARLDSLKYNWEDDIITSICFEDESMMWSTSDTIYTKGNLVTRFNHGEDIGNTLYYSAIINELDDWKGERSRFKNELKDPCLGIIFGTTLPNNYCKIGIRKGKIVYAWVNIGSSTEKQFESCSSRDKEKYYKFVKRAEQNKRRRIEKKNRSDSTNVIPHPVFF